MDGVDAAEGGVSPVVPGLHGAGSLPPGRGDICCASTWSANLAKARHVCEELSGGSCTITETFFYTDGARCKLWYFCKKTGESGHVCDFDHTVSEARPECDRGRAEPPDLDPPREDGGGTSLIFDDGVYPCPWEPLEAVHDGCPEGEGSTYGCCTPVDVSDSPRYDYGSDEALAAAARATSVSTRSDTWCPVSRYERAVLHGVALLQANLDLATYAACVYGGADLALGVRSYLQNTSQGIRLRLVPINEPGALGWEGMAHVSESDAVWGLEGMDLPCGDLLLPMGFPLEDLPYVDRVRRWFRLTRSWSSVPTRSTLIDLAETILHELVHGFGYIEFEGPYAGAQPCSVPWRVGCLFRRLARVRYGHPPEGGYGVCAP